MKASTDGQCWPAPARVTGDGFVFDELRRKAVYLEVLIAHRPHGLALEGKHAVIHGSPLHHKSEYYDDARASEGSELDSELVGQLLVCGL